MSRNKIAERRIITHHVYSTLAADVKYTRYHKQEIALIPGVAPKAVDLPIVEKSVLIKGGAGVAPAGIRKLETPLGVVTPITDDEFELLENNEVFKTHKNNGYVHIRKNKVDAEVVVADMEGRDVSAPIVEADMVKVGNLDEKKPKPSNRFDKMTLKNELQ